MEQAQSFKRVVLVVEEDAHQRASIATLIFPRNNGQG
jgi:hypothetical protein